MKLFLTFIILSLLGLAACQGPKDGNTQRTEIKELPTPPDAEQNGGVDGGGGNGIKGKPLESYQIQISKLPEFEKIILPIIKNLTKAFPELAADLKYLHSEKTWYSVPVSLKSIPPVKLGTFFPTDQIAMQSRNDIWIDSNIYNAMDEESKSKLLLHELIMGVRILEFATDIEKCFAFAARAEVESDYLVYRSECIAKYRKNSSLDDIFKSDTPIDITNDNYAIIRRLTITLYNNIGIVNGTDLKIFLEINNFRNYSTVSTQTNQYSNSELLRTSME